MLVNLLARYGNRAALDPPAAVAYVGPGDIVSGAAAWYGLRAYSAAARGGNVCDIVRASDSASQTFISLADGSLDVASIASFLAATTGKVSKLYDQTGQGWDVLQATDSKRPAFTLSGIGSLPCMTFVRASSQEFASSGNFTGFSQQYSMSMVAKRTGNFSAANGVLGAGGSLIGFNTSVDNANMFAGSNVAAAAADNAFHAVQAVFNGASSVLYVDGSSSTVNAGAGAVSSATTIKVGTNGFGSPLDGAIAEVGIWPAGFSSGDRSSMNSNQHTYWGF